MARINLSGNLLLSTAELHDALARIDEMIVYKPEPRDPKNKVPAYNLQSKTPRLTFQFSGFRFTIWNDPAEYEPPKKIVEEDIP